MAINNISEAKAYIIKRINAQLSYKNNLYDLLDKYALRLVDIAYRANIPASMFSFDNSSIKDEVDALIMQLENEIIDYIDTLAVARHDDDKDNILSFVNDTYNNKNINDIVKDHADHWKNEIEASVAAAILTSITKRELIQSLKTYRTNTWNNPIIMGARKMQHTNTKSKWLYSNPVTAVGNSNSGAYMLDAYGEFMIAMGWTKYMYDDAINSGAVAFKVIRGSHYPCSYCDMECGYIHYDIMGLPPFHANCCCIAIPIYDINNIFDQA
jgi:hypothetical protein